MLAAQLIPKTLSLLLMTASAPGCPTAVPPPQVNVIEHAAPIQQSFVTQEEIAAQNPAVQPELRALNPNGQAGAITMADWRYDISRETAFDQNTRCVWYKSLTINLYPSRKIMIDRGWQKNKCMVKLITEHEMLHMAVFDKALREAADSMKAGAEKVLISVGAFPHNSASFDRIDRAVYNAIVATGDGINAQRIEADRMIDLEQIDEYEAGQRPCGL